MPNYRPHSGTYSVQIGPAGPQGPPGAPGPSPNFADNEFVSGSGTAWVFLHAPNPTTSVHLYVQEYNGGPFVRLPPTAITSIIGTAMVTAASWTAGALMADYRY